MCYSHLGNEARNGSISIMQRGFINDCYKVNPVGQWEKTLAMAMEFVVHLGQIGFNQGVDVNATNPYAKM